MTVYTVLAPEPRSGAEAPDPMSYVFVKEGFAWPALFFAGLWMIYRRMWLVLVAYVALTVAASFVGRQVGGGLPGLFILLGHFWFALEANELRRWALRRRGYRLVGVAEGRGQEEAEIHFFVALEDNAAPPTLPPVVPTAPTAPPRYRALQPSPEAGEVIGLFPAPGGPSS
jgi:hypothetical protein